MHWALVIPTWHFLLSGRDGILIGNALFTYGFPPITLIVWKLDSYINTEFTINSVKGMHNKVGSGS